MQNNNERSFLTGLFCESLGRCNEPDCFHGGVAVVFEDVGRAGREGNAVAFFEEVFGAGVGKLGAAFEYEADFAADVAEAAVMGL